MARTEVYFYDIGEIDDGDIAFAVVASRYQDKWIYVQHRDRDTWEMPGGHRESGESPYEAACRELYEETGAIEYHMTPICVYGVVIEDRRSYGLLCYAHITQLGELPDSEIARTGRFDSIPDMLTYPDIQDRLHARIQMWLK